MTTADVLRASRELIDTPEKWTTGTVCDREGRHCAIGAIARVVLGDDFHTLDGNYTQVAEHPATVALATAMGWSTDGLDETVEVIFKANDRMKSHPKVLAAFDKAIAEAAALTSKDPS